MTMTLYRFLTLFAYATLLIMPGPESMASWGGGSCGPVGSPVYASAPLPIQEVYEWREFADGDRRQVLLLRNGYQIGVWVRSEGVYHRLTPQRSFVPDTAPISPPSWVTQKLETPKVKCPCICDNGKPCSDPCCCGPQCPDCSNCTCEDKKGVKNFGVMADRISTTERYTVDGREVSRKRAIEALSGDPSLIDDSKWLRLTVGGGTPEDRKKVCDDVARHPSFAPFRDHLLVQSYPAEHWAFKDAGFKAGPNGSLVVYVQDAGGGVLSRTEGYPGPEKLAGAVRRAQPDYDPAKDPDLSRPPLPPQPAPPVPPFVPPDPQPTPVVDPAVKGSSFAVPDILKSGPFWAVAGLGGLFLLLHNRKQPK